MPNYDLEMAESVIAARDLKVDELTVALGLATAENKRLKSQLDEFVYVESNPGYVSEAEQKQERIEQLEAALHPGKQSCDCCIRQQYKGETFWMIECQCGNHDDIGRAQAWCSMANTYEGATGKSVSAGESALSFASDGCDGIQFVPDTDT